MLSPTCQKTLAIFAATRECVRANPQAQCVLPDRKPNNWNKPLRQTPRALVVSNAWTQAQPCHCMEMVLAGREDMRRGWPNLPRQKEMTEKIYTTNQQMPGMPLTPRQQRTTNHLQQLDLWGDNKPLMILKILEINVVERAALIANCLSRCELLIDLIIVLKKSQQTTQHMFKAQADVFALAEMGLHWPSLNVRDQWHHGVQQRGPEQTVLVCNKHQSEPSPWQCGGVGVSVIGDLMHRTQPHRFRVLVLDTFRGQTTSCGAHCLASSTHEEPRWSQCAWTAHQISSWPVWHAGDLEVQSFKICTKRCTHGSPKGNTWSCVWTLTKIHNLARWKNFFASHDMQEVVLCWHRDKTPRTPRALIMNPLMAFSACLGSNRLLLVPWHSTQASNQITAPCGWILSNVTLWAVTHLPWCLHKLGDSKLRSLHPQETQWKGPMSWWRLHVCIRSLIACSRGVEAAGGPLSAQMNAIASMHWRLNIVSNSNARLGLSEWAKCRSLPNYKFIVTQLSSGPWCVTIIVVSWWACTSSVTCWACPTVEGAFSADTQRSGRDTWQGMQHTLPCQKRMILGSEETFNHCCVFLC